MEAGKKTPRSGAPSAMYGSGKQIGNGSDEYQDLDHPIGIHLEFEFDADFSVHTAVLLSFVTFGHFFGFTPLQINGSSRNSRQPKISFVRIHSAKGRHVVTSPLFCCEEKRRPCRSAFLRLFLQFDDVDDLGQGRSDSRAFPWRGHKKAAPAGSAERRPTLSWNNSPTISLYLIL